MSNRTEQVVVPLATIADLITRARRDHGDGCHAEAGTWITAVALIVGDSSGAQTAIAEYLMLAVATPQPPSVDMIAARHVLRLGASA